MIFSIILVNCLMRASLNYIIHEKKVVDVWEIHIVYFIEPLTTDF